MKISNLRESGVPNVLTMKVNDEESSLNKKDCMYFVRTATHFTSELELHYLLESSNGIFIILADNVVDYITENFNDLLCDEMITIDMDEFLAKIEISNSFNLNFLIKGSSSQMQVYATKKYTDREIFLLEVKNISYFDILSAQKDRANCIICDEKMSILHISPNLMKLLSIENPKGMPLSNFSFMDISPEGTHIMYFDNEIFTFNTKELNDGNILIELKQPILDAQERKLWAQFSIWNYRAKPYTLVLIDLTSLRLLNMYKGVSYGDRCISELKSILYSYDHESFIYNNRDGTIAFASHMPGIEIKQVLEEARNKITMEYSYRYEIATSNELSKNQPDSFELFKLIYQTAKTRLTWDKSSSKLMSIDILKSIMYTSTPETKIHCSRIQTISLILAEQLSKKYNITSKTKSFLGQGALLHDIGKVFIPPGIINKPGKLTNEEFDIMKKHTLLGAEIFKNNKAMQEVHDIILNHHERYDGKGYPNGVSSKDLPIVVSIVTLVDSVDAILSTRCYKDPQTLEFCLNELIQNKGKQFHPDVVDAFMECLNEDKFDGLLNIEKGDELSNAI